MIAELEKVMTLEECRQRVSRIRDYYGVDPEEAHAMEDGLMREALTACLLKSPDALEMVTLVLELGEEEHRRWYA